MMNLGQPVNTEVIETLGLKVKHNLHCLEEVPVSKVWIPGFGEWVLLIFEGRVLAFLVEGVPESMREEYRLTSAHIPDENVSLRQIIEDFVEFLLTSFASSHSGEPN
ncbi:MAG: hypothetical protein GF334_09685 [Candidatus Altiarchaeales archaeon]|nr:hypothetical protein [Candidatus Altiarchaeales archaeon]